MKFQGWVYIVVQIDIISSGLIIARQYRNSQLAYIYITLMIRYIITSLLILTLWIIAVDIGFFQKEDASTEVEGVGIE